MVRRCVLVAVLSLFYMPASAASQSAAELFSASWNGAPYELAVDAWGPPHASGNGVTWLDPADATFLEARCVRMLKVADGFVRSATLSGRRCPHPSELADLGWLRPVDLERVHVTFHRFHQTYVGATAPELLAIDDRVSIVGSVAVGYHRDTPGNLHLVLRLHDEAAPAGQAPPALAVPQDRALVAEAYILIDGEEAPPMLAIEDVPLRGIAGVGEHMLVVLTPVIDSLRTARTLEVLLPSGLELLVSEDHMAAVRDLLFLATMPERFEAAAER